MSNDMNLLPPTFPFEPATISARRPGGRRRLGFQRAAAPSVSVWLLFTAGTLIGLIGVASLAQDPPPAAPTAPPGATEAEAATPAEPKTEPAASTATAPTATATPTTTESSSAAKAEPAGPKYLAWLAEVDVLISKEEKKTFLALREDYQRDAFIEAFWRSRDPYPDTARNERRERWDQLVAESRSRFGNLTDERAKVLLLNGPPAALVQSQCRLVWPLEIWFYQGSDQMKGEFFLVFYQRWGVGRFRLWDPQEGVLALGQFVAPNTSPGAFLSEISSTCRDGDSITGALAKILSRGALDYNVTVSRILDKPKGPSGEWAGSFEAYTTDIPEDAPKLDLTLEVRFPSRFQNRTVAQALIAVKAESATTIELAGVASYNFLITGEVIRERSLFESFRYRFDFPAAELAAERLPDGRIPLVFERYLRPGKYRLIVRVEDTNGKRYGRHDMALEVPELSGGPPPLPDDPVSAALLAEATAAISTGDVTLKLIAPRSEWSLGMTRFDTLTTGAGIAEVSFELDGREVLRKARPPYSVELDLGKLPRTHELSAVARDSSGKELARDLLTVNSGAHRFRIQLTEPEAGKRYTRSLRAVAELEVPEGAGLDRVEIYFNETLLATLYGEPWVQPILLPENEGLGYVRALAILSDGNSTEDVVFVNAPDYLEEVDIQFVELYAAVVDSAGRPAEGLVESDFTVSEDGVVQTIRRFERVENLPVHVGVLLDTSASMSENLGEAQKAAIGFFESLIQPKDRGAVVTFNDRPYLAAKFSNELTTLAGGLAGLKAERGTALWDSIIFSLFYFNGIKGQRALVVLSDGRDESSKFSFEQTLEYAQRTGVALYTIGLDIPLKHLEARRQLAKLAEQTGGQSFLIDTAAELAPLYASIEKELRSRYLVAYQSTSTAPPNVFRTIEVEVAPRGLTAKTVRGYFP